MTTPLRPTDPRMLGSYVLASRLGQGGMGVTYLATDPRGVPVAIKTMLTSTDELLARFRHEARVTQQVESPYIAPVVDVNLEHDPPFLVTRYIPGEPVRRRVEREGPLPETELRELADALAAALDDLEAHGVVHRDITPANVMLGPDGPSVIDLGIAVIEDATRLTRAGTTVGTLAWMSPEQLAGGPYGPWVDRWSAAAVLVYAATGRSPFGDGPSGAVAHRIETGRADLDDVPAWLAGRVLDCFAVDPHQRGNLHPAAAANVAPPDRPAEPQSTQVYAVEDQSTVVSPQDAPIRSRHVPRMARGEPEPPTTPGSPWGGRAALAAIVSVFTLVVGVFQEGLVLIYVTIVLWLFALILFLLGLRARIRRRR